MNESIYLQDPPAGDASKDSAEVKESSSKDKEEKKKEKEEKESKEAKEKSDKKAKDDAEKSEKEKEKEKDKKEPEPTFEILQNPARVLRAQLKVIQLVEGSQYAPVKDVQIGGIVMVKHIKPDSEEELVEPVAGQWIIHYLENIWMT